MSSKTKAIATADEVKPALVPKLRFPKFQDAWEMTPIGEKVDLLSGYPFDGPEISQDSSGVRLLRGINITEGRIRHTPEIDRYYTGETDGLEKFRVRLNDLVIGMDGSKVGKNSSLISDDDADALLIQRVARLRTSSPTLIQFIFQQINSTTFHSYVDKINTSSGIPHISAKQIKEFTIGFPSPAEQQKIAECLSWVDELMAAQARKVDALKTHKKGLMQQLFPREGETQPRLRFPEFQNAGEWNEIELGEKVDLLSGYPFDGPDISQDGSGIPLLRGINVTEGRIRHNPEIDRYYTGSTEGLEKFRLQANDLVIGMDGSKVGKNSALVSAADAGALLIQRVARLRAKKASLIQFIFQRIHSPSFHAYVDRINTSSGIPHISAKQIKEFRICFPSDDEQQRIATCLSSLDALITAETQKHEALKTHKKGLMQQLFPSQEAATA